jgi:hypothetical protein
MITAPMRLRTWMFLMLAIPSLVRAVALPTSVSPAVDLVVGLSPYLERSVKDDVYRRVVGLLVQDLPGGSSLSIYDACRLTTVTHVVIPTSRAFQNERTRVNQFQEPIRQLRDFLAREAGTNGVETSPVPGTIRMPQFLAFVGEHHARSNHPVTLMVLGNPLYIDPKEPHFSMRDGYFPSDGHLMASKDQSIYGLKGRTNALEGLTVLWGFFGDPWMHELHHDRIQRFWSLYLQEQSGRLGVFSSDLTTVFKSVLLDRNDLHPPLFTLDSSQTQVTMWRLTRTVGESDWITRETVPSTAKIPPRSPLGRLKIGIRWRGAIDLDLYARPRPEAEVLFFDHAQSPEGYYYKDHRASPERDYEFIEFETPVDIRQVEAMVNFYGGEQAAQPTGEVRVEFEGRIYSGTFQLNGLHGNQGRGGPAQTDYWTRVNLLELLGWEVDRSASAR